MYSYTFVSPAARSFLDMAMGHDSSDGIPYLGAPSFSSLGGDLSGVPYLGSAAHTDDTAAEPKRATTTAAAAARHDPSYGDFLTCVLNKYDFSPAQCREMEQRGVFRDWYLATGGKSSAEANYDRFLLHALDIRSNPYHLDFVSSFDEHGGRLREWYEAVHGHDVSSFFLHDRLALIPRDVNEDVLKKVKDILNHPNYKYGVECIDQILSILGARRSKAVQLGLDIARRLGAAEFADFGSVDGIHGILKTAAILSPEIAELMHDMHIDKAKIAYDIYDKLSAMKDLASLKDMPLGDAVEIASLVVSLIPGVDPKIKAVVSLVSAVLKLKAVLAMGAAAPPLQVAYCVLLIVAAAMQLVDSCSDPDSDGGGGGDGTGSDKPGRGSGGAGSIAAGDGGGEGNDEGQVAADNAGAGGREDGHGLSDLITQALMRDMMNNDNTAGNMLDELDDMLQERFARTRKGSSRRGNKTTYQKDDDFEEDEDMDDDDDDFKPDNPQHYQSTHARIREALRRIASRSKAPQMIKLHAWYEAIYGLGAEFKAANDLFCCWELLRRVLGINRNAHEDDITPSGKFTATDDNVKCCGQSANQKAYYSIATGINLSRQYNNASNKDEYQGPIIKPFQSNAPAATSRSSYATNQANKGSKKRGKIGANHDTHLQEQIVSGSFTAKQGEVNDVEYGNDLEHITSMSRMGLISSSSAMRKLTRRDFIERKLPIYSYTQELEEARDQKWLLITEYDCAHKRFNIDNRQVFAGYIRDNILSLEVKRELETSQRKYYNIVKNEEFKEGSEFIFGRVKHKDHELYSAITDWGIQCEPVEDMLRGNGFNHRHSGDPTPCSLSWRVGMGQADHDHSAENASINHPRSTYKAQLHDSCPFNGGCTAECHALWLQSSRCSCTIARMHDSCSNFSVCIDLLCPADEPKTHTDCGCVTLANLRYIRTYIMYG